MKATPFGLSYSTFASSSSCPDVPRTTIGDFTAPETELLLLCSRSTFPSEIVRRMEHVIAQRLEWECVVQNAYRHGVHLLLYRALSQSSLKAVPPNVLEALHNSARTTMARNLAQAAALVTIVDTFARENLPIIPFKGPSLALAAYGDLGMRSFCDLDVLVCERDFVRARDLLTKLGYKPEIAPNTRQERDYRKTDCALTFHDETRGFVVELHWRLSERNTSMPLNLDEFWTRSIPMTLANRKIKTFCPEDLLLYLCIHGAKHRWDRLEWLSSVGELICGNPHLDWPAVQQRARAARAQRILHVGLHLTNTLLTVTLPQEVKQQVDRDEAVRYLCLDVCQRLFASATTGTHYQHRAAIYWFQLRSRESWSDRLKILWASAVRPPHPNARELIDLPPALGILHYLLRPARLLAQFGAVAWRHYSR